ncbi:hypothetical protein HSIEG1_264 [Enterococcus sp. HSIEG1]|nr:hypothetical protein HSIEG1_264 [Enterococcus sp. HSIEG1]
MLFLKEEGYGMEIDLQMLAMIFIINMAYVTLNTIRFY